MTLRHALPLAFALVAVFAALTISVVDARDPLDPAVEASFDSVASQLPAAYAQPLGCHKASLSYYDCRARVRLKGTSESLRLRYRIWLEEDGCWKTTVTESPISLPREVAQPRGCLAT